MIPLITGYLPARVRHIESLVAEDSASADVLRLGPGLTLRECSQLRDFLRLEPVSEASAVRTAVLDLDGMRPGTAAALLKLLEEPPRTARLILTAAELWTVLDTIRSRCAVLEFSPASYAQVLRDLRDRGLGMEQAVRATGQVLTGVSLDALPSSVDHAQAVACLKAIRSHELHEVARLAPLATPGSVGELRRAALADGHITELLRSYLIADLDTEVLMLLGVGNA